LAAAFAILKDSESEPPGPLSGRVLKICSLKVADESLGLRLGELLLKAILDHARSLKADWLFLSVFRHHEQLIELLEDFGFRGHETPTPLGELVFSKPLDPNLEPVQPAGALEQHVRYGPPHLPMGVPWYLVPIEPRYSRVLFPDCQSQATLLPGRYPFGNALRKAYLSRSPLREMQPGSILVFYGSRVQKAAFALGVVEETFRSTAPDEIARRVARRSVYSFEEITRLCSGRAVLSILFRYAERLVKTLPYEELLRSGVLQGPPQSIQTVPSEGIEWLLQHRR
jgi:hypothetical protein